MLETAPDDWMRRKRHRLEGTQCIVRGRLGECPKGWKVSKIDIALYYRADGRPLAFVGNRGCLKIVRLDRKGFRPCRDGRWPLVYLADIQKRHPLELPWKGSLKWLEELTPRFDVTAFLYCERGECAPIDVLRDYYRALPHEYPTWEHRVWESVWYFREYHRSPAELLGFDEPSPPELPPVLALQQ